MNCTSKNYLNISHPSCVFFQITDGKFDREKQNINGETESKLKQAQLIDEDTKTNMTVQKLQNFTVVRKLSCNKSKIPRCGLYDYRYKQNACKKIQFFANLGLIPSTLIREKLSD